MSSIADLAIEKIRVSKPSRDLKTLQRIGIWKTPGCPKQTVQIWPAQIGLHQDHIGSWWAVACCRNAAFWGCSSDRTPKLVKNIYIYKCIYYIHKESWFVEIQFNQLPFASPATVQASGIRWLSRNAVTSIGSVVKPAQELKQFFKPFRRCGGFLNLSVPQTLGLPNDQQKIGWFWGPSGELT